MPALKFPTIPSIDLTSFDVNKVVPQQLRNITLPKIDMPKFVAPQIDANKVRTGEVGTSEVDPATHGVGSRDTR